MTTPVHFVVTIPTYNAEAYVVRAIESALAQDYRHYSIVVSDDGSTDATVSRVQETFAGLDFVPAVALRQSDRNQGPLANHILMAQHARPDDVIVNLDGDDQLAHDGVLSALAEVYADPEVWVTYGSYAYDLESRNPDGDPRGHARQMPPDRHDRRSGFLCSHLRTYKRWLVDKIDGTDFQIDGRFYPCAGDLALMFPMVEMAGPAHARFIEDVLYLYNAVNPLNEARVFDPAPYVQTLYDAPIYQPLADREAVPCRLSQHPA